MDSPGAEQKNKKEDAVVDIGALTTGAGSEEAFLDRSCSMVRLHLDTTRLTASGIRCKQISKGVKVSDAQLAAVNLSSGITRSRQAGKLHLAESQID
jgi:hypothetical protein